MSTSAVYYISVSRIVHAYLLKDSVHTLITRGKYSDAIDVSRVTQNVYGFTMY